LDFFVAAYKETGWSVLSFTEKGTFELLPYTELEEAKIKCFGGVSLHASRRLKNPVILLSMYA